MRDRPAEINGDGSSPVLRTNPNSEQIRNRVRRALALPIAEIRAISSSVRAKSKISMFSDSRSIRDVRGIAATFCWTSQRRQTCAAVLP